METYSSSDDEISPHRKAKTLGLSTNRRMETYSSSDDEILPEASVFEFRANNILQSKLEALKDLHYSSALEKPLEECEPDESEVDSKEKEKEESSEDESSSLEEEDHALQISPVKPVNIRSRKRISDSNDILKSKGVKQLSLESKRKIQELQLNSTRQKRRIALENERVLSACDSVSSKEVVEEDTSSRKIILKFRYLTNLSKEVVKMGDKFSSSFEKIAELYNVKQSELLFCVQDQTIKADDTPMDLNLKYFDIIDCIPCRPSDVEKKTKSKFLLKFQSKSSRKKVEIHGSKFDKLEDFMKQYSEMQNIPLNNLKFEFDGEIIEGSETPEELEMESGSCIDVKSLKKDSPNVSCKDKENEIQIVADVISKSNQIQVCVLD